MMRQRYPTLPRYFNILQEEQDLCLSMTYGSHKYFLTDIYESH